LLFIVVSSLFFYGWWDARYIALLLMTGGVDFLGALAIERWRAHKRLFLSCSLLANLGVLIYFKYSLFFARILQDSLGLSILQGLADKVVLPIGLSFYTFQSMSYTIDVFRGRMTATRNPLLFFAFISFFPHLVAGPIVRAREILPQLLRPRKVSEAVRYHALKLIAIGYFKKTVMADHLASFVAEAFNSKQMSTGFDFWWLAVLAFTFQIYFDFSGYSDIARGLAKLVGIHFRVNFRRPYLATSFKQFWTRWHISLSTWFKEYVYIPLGGSRVGTLWGLISMAATMLLSGLWHGANYTFVVWGGLHAVYLGLERLTGFAALGHRNLVSRLIATCFVFVGTVIAWTFFRAQDLNQAFTILANLGDLTSPYPGRPSDAYVKAAYFIAFASVIEVVGALKISWKLLLGRKMYHAIDLLSVASMIVACLFFRGPGEQFIYFQF
jgi:D-alanyl-lipoteichoic acid acyltransferase DltB (MBOAT superfamily)